MKNRTTATRFTLGIAITAGALLPAASAVAQTPFYFENFESGRVGPEWTLNTRIETSYPTLSKFSGRYSNDSVKLRLAQPIVILPGGATGGGDDGSGGDGGGGGGSPPIVFSVRYTLTFDLYVVDSWDGLEARYGVDRFSVGINGVTAFNEAFSNHAQIDQTFRAPDASFHANANNYRDSVYRRISLNFTLPKGDQINVRFADGGLQGLNDESWGIDNVGLGYQVVPTPAPLALLGVAAIGRGRRRR